jgi:hypothetical protein
MGKESAGALLKENPYCKSVQEESTPSFPSNEDKQL